VRKDQEKEVKNSKSFWVVKRLLKSKELYREIIENFVLGGVKSSGASLNGRIGT